MDLSDLVRRLRNQARACAQLGSPLYAYLIERVADDTEQGGPAVEVLHGHEDDPARAAVALRLLGGAHRLVLERRAPALALTYPSVGGTGRPEAAWEALRELIVSERDYLRAALDVVPQTNEVGRAAVLLGGLLHVVASAAPGATAVRLVELGASAGLNLRAERFGLEWVDVSRSGEPSRKASDPRAATCFLGPADSRVVLRDAWSSASSDDTTSTPAQIMHRGGYSEPQARQPYALDIVERFGCDLAPVDPTTTQGRLLLTSYVWPDQLDRLERLRGALAIAAEVPAPVHRASAADFLDTLELVEGTTTVVWHSIVWQYLSDEEQARAAARIETLGAAATGTAAFAHLSMEHGRASPGDPGKVLVTVRTWPGAEPQMLGTTRGHGIPTTWS